MSIKKYLNIVLAVSALFVGTSVFAQTTNIITEANGVKYVADQLIIKFKDNKVDLDTARGIQTLSQLESKQDFQTEDIVSKENIALISIDEAHSLQSEIARLSLDPTIEYVQPNYAYELLMTPPNDTKFSKQWALNNVGQYADVDPYFWVQGSGTAGADIDRLRAMDIRSWDNNPLTTWTTVAVIDVGFEYTHTDLLSNIWNSTNCLTITWGTWWWCIGWWFDAYTLSRTGVTGFHGTYVAGIVWAKVNNNFGIAWVNPNAILMNINASHWWYIYSFAAAYAISFAQYNWAKILNLSRWTQRFNTRSNPDPTVYNAIKGFSGLVAIAAGNWKTEHVGDYYVTPADFAVDTAYRSWLDNIISVWWSSQRDTLVEWSTYGSDYGTIISISAPACVWTLTTSNGTDWSCGTSFSAPHVAGSLSLLRSMRPDLSYLQIKNALLDHAESIPALIGKFYNGRRLNIFQAMQYLYVQQLSGINVFRDQTRQQNITSGTYLLGTSWYIERWLSSISGQVSQYLVNLEYSWRDLGTTGTTQTGITLDLSGSWIYEVTITPISADKNLTWETLSYTFLADTTMPTASVIYTPVSGTYTSGDVIVTLTWYSEPLYNINATWYTFTGNGTFIFTFSDIGWNTGSVIATVNRIDKDVPTAQVLYMPTSWNLTSGNVEVVLTWYSEPLYNINATWYTFTGNGTFIFSFADWVGNTGSTVATVGRIDKIPPTATILYSRTWRTNQDVVATLSGSEILTGTNATWYTFTGNGTFTFTFFDLAGNTWSAMASVTGIDKESPTAQVIYNISGPWTDQDVEAVLTGYSEPLYNINASWHIFTGNGIYIFTFADLAGNSGTVTGEVTWIYKINQPDPFSFTAQTSKELSTGYFSNEITLTGLNTWATMTIQWWSYSLNSWALQTIAAIVHNGDTIKIYLTSSSAYSSTTSATLTVGGLTGTFSITTKAEPVWPGGGWDRTTSCTMAYLICSGGVYTKKAGVSCEWGSLWMSCATTWTIIVQTWANSGNIQYPVLSGYQSPLFSPELNQAYSYARQIGITTMPTIERANMTGTLIRQDLAKMMSNFTINVLDKKPNTGMHCIFQDMQNSTAEMKIYVKLACQLGLMWLASDGAPNTNFFPEIEVTRAQFGTVLSRALRGDTYNDATAENYFTEHLRALHTIGIMKNIYDPLMLEIRWYVMIMMMRSADAN